METNHHYRHFPNHLDASKVAVSRYWKQLLHVARTDSRRRVRAVSQSAYLVFYNPAPDAVRKYFIIRYFSCWYSLIPGQKSWIGTCYDKLVGVIFFTIFSWIGTSYMNFVVYLPVLGCIPKVGESYYFLQSVPTILNHWYCRPQNRNYNYKNKNRCFKLALIFQNKCPK